MCSLCCRPGFPIRMLSTVTFTVTICFPSPTTNIYFVLMYLQSWKQSRGSWTCAVGQDFRNGHDRTPPKPIASNGSMHILCPVPQSEEERHHTQTLASAIFPLCVSALLFFRLPTLSLRIAPGTSFIRMVGHQRRYGRLLTPPTSSSVQRRRRAERDGAQEASEAQGQRHDLPAGN